MPSRRSVLIVAVLMTLSLFSTVIAEAQWVFVAKKALGAVKRFTGQSQGQDIATVLLEADADKVYAAAVNIIADNKNLRVTHKDASQRTIEFTHGQTAAGIMVSPLQEGLSQLMISSVVSEKQQSGTPLVLDGVFRVCDRLGVRCSLSNN